MKRQEKMKKVSRVVKINLEGEWENQMREATKQAFPVQFLLMDPSYSFLSFIRSLCNIINIIWLNYVEWKWFAQVVVHFGASWCMPSVAINPSFQNLSSSYQHVSFFILDVDELQVIHSKSHPSSCLHPHFFFI